MLRAAPGQGEPESPPTCPPASGADWLSTDQCIFALSFASFAESMSCHRRVSPNENGRCTPGGAPCAGLTLTHGQKSPCCTPAVSVLFRCVLPPQRCRIEPSKGRAWPSRWLGTHEASLRGAQYPAPCNSGNVLRLCHWDSDVYYELLVGSKHRRVTQGVFPRKTCTGCTQSCLLGQERVGAQ